MVLLFLFLESMKISKPYLFIFQASAGSSQAGVADLVQCFATPGFVTFANAQFLCELTLCIVGGPERDSGRLVKIAGETAVDARKGGVS
jgi:hypothetical protein